MGYFFASFWASCFLKLQRCKVATDRKATISFPLQDSCLRRSRREDQKQFVAKSRKESQSDHFIFFATEMPLFDSQEPGRFPTIHESRNLLPRSKRRGSQSVETQETRRPNHLQTNIEPWSEGVEPRKKKRSYWLLSSNALISVIILP